MASKGEPQTPEWLSNKINKYLVEVAKMETHNPGVQQAHEMGKSSEKER